MQSDPSKMNSNEYKSEMFARQLVRNTFSDVRNVENFEEWNPYAQDICHQLKAGLTQFFDKYTPPKTEKDLCGVCGRKGIKESMLAHSRLGEAQMWQRNGNDREWALKRMGELEAAAKASENQ